MALEFRHLVETDDSGHIYAAERLCLTEERDRLVPDTDPEARWLYCTPGTRISEDNAKRFGLKARSAPENKAVDAPEANKADDDKAALLAEAEALGIKVHPNAKADTIRRRIDEARAAARATEGE